MTETRTVHEYAARTWVNAQIHDSVSPEVLAYMKAASISDTQSNCYDNALIPVRLDQWRVEVEEHIDKPDHVTWWVIGYVIKRDEMVQ